MKMPIMSDRICFRIYVSCVNAQLVRWLEQKYISVISRVVMNHCIKQKIHIKPQTVIGDDKVPILFCWDIRYILLPAVEKFQPSRRNQRRFGWDFLLQLQIFIRSILQNDDWWYTQWIPKSWKWQTDQSELLRNNSVDLPSE